MVTRIYQHKILIEYASPFIELLDKDTRLDIKLQNDGEALKSTYHCKISTVTPRLIFEDTQYSKLANLLYDGSDDLLHVDKDIKHDPTGTKILATLLSHASRHDRGGADSLDYTKIIQLTSTPGYVDCSLGTGGSKVRTIVYEVQSPWVQFIPLLIYVNVGGTIATDESIDVDLVYIFNDGSEIIFYSGSYTSTGIDIVGSLQYLWQAVLNDVISKGTAIDGKRIVKLAVDAASSASSTSVTLSVAMLGLKA